MKYTRFINPNYHLNLPLSFSGFTLVCSTLIKCDLFYSERITMKVNGEAFKKTRQELRKDHTRGVVGQPAIGSQEWLATKTGLSVRLIQRLEKGEASVATVDKVSPFLKINGREFIEGFGKNFVIPDAKGYIDLRPAVSPRSDPDAFPHSAMMLTVDPLELECKADEFDSYFLREITAKLVCDTINIDFEWAYEVDISPKGENWLPIKNDVRSLKILTPAVFFQSIMFKQTSRKFLSWSEFVEKIEASSDSLLKLELKINFENFYKILHIGLCIELLKENLSNGRKKYKCQWPYRTQLRVKSMTWMNT